MSTVHSTASTSHANTTTPNPSMIRRPPPPTLHIPDLDSLDPEAAAHMHHHDLDGPSGPSGPRRSTTVQASPIPFPRISQRRKLVRGVGNEPWHHKPSSDSDSDSDVANKAVKPAHQTRRPNGNAPSTHTSLTNEATPPPVLPSPSPEAMPGFDAKRTYSESQLTPSLSATAAAAASIAVAPVIRKKSGQIVKSSLKSPSTSSMGSSVSFTGSSREGSVPSTPTSLAKFVHFDGQLEHIKIFRKEQKPAAVSAEASPIDSEESDWERRPLNNGNVSDGFMRSSEEERVRSTLVLEPINLPLRNPLATARERLGELDVRLQSIALSKDARSIEGSIIVRNLAFEKWVAVRFTFDAWATTSEVTARYVKSADEDDHVVDLFEFAIRLPDVLVVLARRHRRYGRDAKGENLEERRLMFALKYIAAGREMWDNNYGQNYQVRFKTEERKEKKAVDSRHPPSWPVKSANVDQMADLRKQLEKVVREDEESSGFRRRPARFVLDDEDDEDEEASRIGGWEVLTAKLRAKNANAQAAKDGKITTLQPNSPQSLKERYGWEQSLKVKWNPEARTGSNSPGVAFPRQTTPNAGNHQYRQSYPSLNNPSYLPSSSSATLQYTPPSQSSGYPFPVTQPLKPASKTQDVPPQQLHLGSWRSPRGSPRDLSNGTGTDYSAPSSPKFFIDPRDAHRATPNHHHHHTGAPVARPRNHTRGGGYFDSYMDRRTTSASAVLTPTTGSLSAAKESVDMTASSSVDSCTTVTPANASPVKGSEPPSVLVTEESTEGSSESDSSISSSSIVISRDGLFLNEASNEQARPVRFNSYPMDRTHLSTPPASSSPAATPATTVMSPASLTVPQPSWLNSPQGSISSMSTSSTPSFTSASSPSQSPSSPSELSDSVKSIQQMAGGRPGVNSFDYNTFLQRFCYYTGSNKDSVDRHGVSNAYGSTHHRHSLSESTLDGHLPWDTTPVTTNAKDVDVVSLNDGWSDESGHTTPTRSSTPRGSGLAEPIDFGKRTPRPGSPAVFGESTPRQAEFVRPHRGSL
ncbi:hypothetical protein CPB86DRAFT_797456 [Serendipita vermifera]|nr:hypothetical protein CPB86DRAFT_797456 [Serendipita vermifera]